MLNFTKGEKTMPKIPKVIHFCWFGGAEYPDLIKNCMASWEKYLPEYEIVKWSEENFDVNCNQYVKEAYENKSGHSLPTTFASMRSITTAVFISIPMSRCSSP